MPEFVRYWGRKGEKSPTAAASQFYKDLVAVYGASEIINFGQGAETENPPDSLMRPTQSVHTVQYRVDAGGEEAMRVIAADWAVKFLGVPAAQENTFVLQKQGREGSREAITFASTQNGSEGASFIKFRWPMYDAIVGRVRGAKVVLHKNPDGPEPDEAHMRSLENGVFIETTNSPENPTGSIYAVSYMKTKGARLEDINAKLGTAAPFPRNKLFHHIDVPYFYAGPQDISTYRFNLGYEHVTKPDAKTPWIMVVSFSKALGTATPGLCFVITHPALAKNFQNQLTHGGGLSYDPGFFEWVSHVFDRSNYEAQARHFLSLQGKYRINRDTFTDRFGPAILPGNPGMTLLMKESTTLAPGKKVETGGHVYPLETTADLIEYGGNTQRLVFVDNGQEGNDAYIRAALAQKPARFAPGVDRLEAIIRSAQLG